MKRWYLVGIVLVCLIVAPAIGEEPEAVSDAKTKEPKVTSLTLRVRHRVYVDFQEDSRVQLKEGFQIGDTELSARVDRFVPDFALNLDTGEVVSRSPEPNNPAFRVVVFKSDEPQDTTWAFMNWLPHYTRRSMVAFQVIRIEFEGRDPIVLPDSLKTEDKKS